MMNGAIEARAQNGASGDEVTRTLKFVYDVVYRLTDESDDVTGTTGFLATSNQLRTI